MILWTIQPKEVYIILLSEGVFRCDSARSQFGKDFKDGYMWMSNQMKKRVGNPPSDVVYPIWAWFQWEGVRKKPDLRRERWLNGCKGDPFVCIELEIPTEKVLLSDFDAWHYILNDWLISYSEEEDNSFEHFYSSLTSEEQQKYKHINWERIFDITPINNGWILKGRNIQASFWELRKEYILNTVFFTSAKNNY